MREDQRDMAMSLQGEETINILGGDQGYMSTATSDWPAEMDDQVMR